MLAAYIRRQPSQELYQVRGPVALLLYGGQLAAVVHATAAAQQVGIRRILGLESLECWLGDGPVSPEPEAQGPALNEAGALQVSGPFAWSRHPLNFSPVPVFWLNPRMTTNLLAFNLAATTYQATVSEEIVVNGTKIGYKLNDIRQKAGGKEREHDILVLSLDLLLGVTFQVQRRNPPQPKVSGKTK